MAKNLWCKNLLHQSFFSLKTINLSYAFIYITYAKPFMYISTRAKHFSRKLVTKI